MDSNIRIFSYRISEEHFRVHSKLHFNRRNKKNGSLRHSLSKGADKCLHKEYSSNILTFI